MPAVRPRARRVPRREHGGDRAVELLPRVLREVAAGVLAADRQELLRRAPRALAASRSTSATTPRALLARVSASSKRSLGTPSTRWRTSARSGGSESAANRGLPVALREPGHRARRSTRGSGSCPSSPASTPVSRSGPRRGAGRPGRRGACRSAPPARRGAGTPLIQPVRPRAAAGEIRATGLGRHREAVRHGKADRRHLGELRALPSEKIAHLARAVREGVDVGGHRPRSLARNWEFRTSWKKGGGRAVLYRTP